MGQFRTPELVALPYLEREGMEQVRVDKWLWAARFFKTRSAAAAGVLGGRVHVNGVRVKPAKEVRAGDMVQVTTRSDKRTVEVVDVTDKRGTATTAATLYTETAESISAREKAALERRLARPPGADLGARPTKLDRRRLEAMRRAHRHGRLP
jgi:ribosome-associated heat shock protein Hsp15